MQLCNHLYSAKDKKPYTMLCRKQSAADEQLSAPIWLFLCDPFSAVTQTLEALQSPPVLEGKLIPLL